MRKIGINQIRHKTNEKVEFIFTRQGWPHYPLVSSLLPLVSNEAPREISHLGTLSEHSLPSRVSVYCANCEPSDRASQIARLG